MYYEVRKSDDLEYFRKMLRYTNLIKGKNCLHIEFFWKFDRNKTPEAELEEAEMLVDLLLTADSYKKLTIGSDGLWSCYLPIKFIQIFIRELGQR